MLITSSEDDGAEADLGAAYAPVEGLGIPCEVIPCSRGAFERERRTRTGVCRRVAEEGRLVYERR